MRLKLSIVPKSETVETCPVVTSRERNAYPVVRDAGFAQAAARSGSRIRGAFSPQSCALWLAEKGCAELERARAASSQSSEEAHSEAASWSRCVLAFLLSDLDSGAQAAERLGTQRDRVRRTSLSLSLSLPFSLSVSRVQGSVCPSRRRRLLQTSSLQTRRC